MYDVDLHDDWRMVQEDVIFNRFSMEIRSLMNEESECLKKALAGEPVEESELVTGLLEDGILTRQDSPDSLVDEFEQEATDASDVRLNQVRFFVTEECNMGCPGCFVRFKYRNDEEFESSDAEKARQVVDFLREENEGESFHIHFLGGEPLLKMDLIRETIEYTKEVCEETDYRFSVTTNATVVTDERADYLAEHDVVTGVSFDGVGELNDESRMYLNGEGTYDDAVEGYRKLKEHLDEVGILITPQPLNIDELDDIVEQLIDDLDPDGVTINDPFHSDGEWEVDGRKFAEKIKDIILTTGKKEISLISPASQVIRAVANDNPKTRTLVSTQGEMTAAVSIDGRITYHIMTYDESLFPNPVEDRSEELFEEWATFSGYQHEKCRDCIALNTCSGPDPFESFQGNGDIDNIELNVERCKFYKEITPWLVENMAKAYQ